MLGYLGAKNYKTTSRYSRPEPYLTMSEGSVHVYPSIHPSTVHLRKQQGWHPFWDSREVFPTGSIFSHPHQSARLHSSKRLVKADRIRQAKTLVTPPKRKPLVKIYVVEAGQNLFVDNLDLSFPYFYCFQKILIHLSPRDQCGFSLDPALPMTSHQPLGPPMMCPSIPPMTRTSAGTTMGQSSLVPMVVHPKIAGKSMDVHSPVYWEYRSWMIMI